ncbi:MAG: hypothetical protein ACKO96_22490, partial [Flammeovirgaceae bacterium]
MSPIPMARKNTIAYIVFCLSISVLHAQSVSVLSRGDWYKFAVTNDGIYRIDYNLLRSSGVNPDQIDPRNIKIYAGQTGMLPQANRAPRLKDLAELAVFVSGEEDGKFNKQDFILFHGQGPDQLGFDVQKKIFHYQNNLFSDKN